jgi:SAM-dependent methyltransferase
MATPSVNRPTPERIFDGLRAFQLSAALKAAIELEIFTAIAEGATDSAAIARRAGTAERGARILCDYLTIQGFLTKESGKYGLAPDAQIFLNKHSPAYLGGVFGFLCSPPQRQGFESLTEAVRRGGTALKNGDNTQENDVLWIEFARTMAPLTAISAGFMADLLDASSARPFKVLDIAASHGQFGIAIARRNPLARIVALDWPNVLRVAQENANAAGLGDRYSLLPGSAFEVDLGSGYDAVLVTNLLHHFDPPTCERLMRRVHAALKPGGKALTLEFVPNEDRISPPMAAGFSLVMLASTDSGDAYTFAEYEKMFRNAGFARTTLHPVPDMPQQVLVSEK